DMVVADDQLGRYYLLENPGGALSWVFDGVFEGIPMRLLDTADGKFTYGDQCAYGKIGKTGQPVRKRTG
ncbi:unnamed protein product, partial [Effrenium voratum]